MLTFQEEYKISGENEKKNYVKSIAHIEKIDLKIIGVEMKEKYHRGTTHYLVDQKVHSWKYKDNDE